MLKEIILTEEQREQIRVKLLDNCVKDPETGCWNWTRAISRGYGYIYLPGNPIGYLAHRVSWMIWRGDFDTEKPYTLHKCDNRRCVNPDHLFAGTLTDNMQVCLNKGRRDHKGVRNANRKLTEGEVRQIRKMYKPGESGRIAKMFGITYGHAFKIATRRMWDHIPD